MPVQSTIDYYRILGVPPNATAEEIRRSFRRLVLLLHPDKNPDRSERSERRIRELIEAYEVIGDREKRRAFDVEFGRRKSDSRQRASGRAGKGESGKVPEETLFFFRKSDPNAYALRVLYFLVNGRGPEAVPLLTQLEERWGAGFLRQELERGDYLDCLFLLGEYHLGRREYVAAFRRIRAFWLHDRNSRFPRHYLDAVVTHLKDLYLRRLPQSMAPSEAIEALREAADLDLSARERVRLERVLGELRAKLPREAPADEAGAARNGNGRGEGAGNGKGPAHGAGTARGGDKEAPGGGKRERTRGASRNGAR